MKLKKLGAALDVVLAFGAVMASSAFATATTETVNWKTGATAGGVTTLVGTQAVTSSATENFTLETTVATKPLVLEATGTSCVSCVIENSSGAKGKGFIEFQNVQVIEPATCKVSGEKVLTKELKVDATYMEGTSNLIQFLPVGSTFATLKLEKKGTPACPISGSYNITGSVFGKSANATKVFKTSQGVSFSGAINSAAGGALFFEAEPASLKGAASFVAGGKFFGTE